MGYEWSDLTEESLPGCSNKSSEEVVAGERKPEV